jgi:hypothetical protein
VAAIASISIRKSSANSLEISTSVTAGAAAGVLVAKEAVARFAVLRDAAHVANKHRELCDMAGGAINCGQRNADVAERLLRLRAEIIAADEIAVCTENWIRLDARQRLGNPAT